jgi:magnesium transporter
MARPAETTTVSSPRSASEVQVGAGSAPAPTVAASSGDASILHAHAWTPTDGLRHLTSIDEVETAFRDPTSRIWVDVEDVSPALLERLGACLGLHPLVVEDIIERNQRAKVEHTGDLMHLVMFALTWDEELRTIELDIVLGERFLLTSHPPEWRPLKTRDVSRLGIEHFLSRGTDLLLYAVVDPVVDGYFPVIDRLSDEIDLLEYQVVESPSKAVLERLFRIRRDLLGVRHMVGPEREVFNQLTNRDNPLIAESRLIYFRDVYDHLIRVTDELDTHRELISGALEAYLSTINNGMSDVMKRLTAVTAVLAGVGATAGIFGMSEAGAALNLVEAPGFWIVTAFVIVIGVVILAYFKRIDWI